MDAVAEGTYQHTIVDSYDYIDANIANLSVNTGVEILDNGFYSTKTYSIGWGKVDSGFQYNGRWGAIVFPHEDYYYETFPITQNLTNEMIEAMGDDSGDPRYAMKVFVFNSEANELNVDYYDIFGDKKGTFVFSDGVQKLNGKDLFENGEYKKYSLVYSDTDQSVEFSLELSSSEHPSAWTELTSCWNTNYSGKTFDVSKLSLHRKADFSVNSYYNDATPDDLSYLKARMHDDDLWWVTGEEYKYIAGGDLYDYIDNYNSSSHLRLYFDNISIYLSSDPLVEDEYYKLNSKPINKIPFDLNDMIDNIPEYNEVVWTLWNATESGWCHVKTKVAIDQRRLVDIDDLNDANDAVFEYKFMPIVYTVNLQDGGTLDVTVDNGAYPAGGGEYVFTYGDSVRKVVKNGAELWAEIAKVAKNYDSTKANLTKIQSIASAVVNVEAPKIGGTPADAKVNSTQYEVTETTWTPAAGKFAAYTAYTVTAVLKPSADFKFTDNVTATVNGQKAKAVLNSDGTITVTYTFAKMDPWDDIRNIDLSKNPVIKVPAGGGAIPKDIFEKIKDSGKIITIEYPDGTKWEIDGTTIDLDKVPDGGIDLSVSKISEEHWATVVNRATGHMFRMQISIAYSGEFGFTAYLVVDLSDGMTGISSGTYYANLYQILSNSLKWNCSDVLALGADGKWTARLKFTHASQWLITIDDKSDPRQDDGHSGGSGSPRRDDDKIVPAGTSKSSGWENITKEIQSADIGATIAITLNDEPVITDAAAKAAASRRVKLVIDAGYGRIWTINGADLKGSLNLSTSGVNVNIPAEAYKDIACAGSVQFSAAAGDLGFTAQISVPVGKDNAGRNAAFYRYNETSGRLEFVAIATVGNDGTVTAGITRGGKYFVAYGDNVKAPEIAAGDLNGDGIVNAVDASLILRSLVENKTIAVELGDFNKDGAVNAFDASAILRSVVNG